MNKRINPAYTAILAGIGFPIAFDPGKAGWKMDADGKLAADANGNPIYIDAEGREMVTEAGTIARLNGEAKTHREAKERAEMALQKFKDLDPDAARKAIETVSKIDAKKLIDAGEVDKLKEQIKTEFTGQLTEAQKREAALNDELNGMRRSTAFKGSKFLQERVAVPAEMFEATFGKNFKIEEGKLVPYGSDGNKIYSKKRVGEIADFDEALELIVENYPYKDNILKAPNASGTGSNGNGGNRGTGRTIKRADFDKMPPVDQAALAGQMQKGEVAIVD